MTIKEIAEMVQITPETVRVKAKELYPQKFEKGKKTTFTKEESISIVGELRKKGFIQPTENLEVGSRLDRLESLVEKMLSVIIETKQIQPMVKELPAPEKVMASRDQIREIINDYSSATNTEHREAWTKFYDKLYYALHININQRRLGTSKSGLDILDELALTDKALEVAKVYFK